MRWVKVIQVVMQHASAKWNAAATTCKGLTVECSVCFSPDITGAVLSATNIQLVLIFSMSIVPKVLRIVQVFFTNLKRCFLPWCHCHISEHSVIKLEGSAKKSWCRFFCDFLVIVRLVLETCCEYSLLCKDICTNLEPWIDRCQHICSSEPQL